ncbi:hypothetical protein ABZ714_15345 [Streptomyces sp. NPDC006798]|uniref:hypothetical protein n=1 Tax=Streptomyces sp. NPDC006798 TaxID=3155462 RepID=UPI0033E7D472
MRRGGTRWAKPLLALTTVAIATLTTACGSDDDEPRAPDERGARAALHTYVDALNARDPAALMEIGGVPADREAEREAARILKERGGKGLTVERVDIAFDFGPDVGSARLTTKDRSGATGAETITVSRDGGPWQVAVFFDRPGGNKSESSSVERP